MDIVTELQKNNPYVLTTLQGFPVFMNKNNPIYKAKKNDRIVSVDCVLANEKRLVEITDELDLDSSDGVFELQG